jgi:hypothetical protein
MSLAGNPERIPPRFSHPTFLLVVGAKERGHYCSYPTVLIRNAANFVDLIFVSSIMILLQKNIRKASNKAKKA